MEWDFSLRHSVQTGSGVPLVGLIFAAPYKRKEQGPYTQNLKTQCGIFTFTYLVNNRGTESVICLCTVIVLPVWKQRISEVNPSELV
jgi:hypothetical protein